LVGVAVIGLGSFLRVIAQRASSVMIGPDGVAIRNWPRVVRRVPLSAVDRFDERTRESAWNQKRVVSAVLVLKDGKELPVRSLGDPELTRGLPGLNNQLNALRGPTR
jgi:hypothetical protein